MVREGSGGHFHNMLIDGYGFEVLDTRDEVLSLVSRGTLTFSDNYMANLGQLGVVEKETNANDDDFGFSEQDWMAEPSNRNQFSVESALFPSAMDLVNPNFMSKMQLRNIKGARPPKSEFFDESATFIGVIDPLSSVSWLEGWTSFPES